MRYSELFDGGKASRPDTGPISGIWPIRSAGRDGNLLWVRKGKTFIATTAAVAAVLGFAATPPSSALPPGHDTPGGSSYEGPAESASAVSSSAKSSASNQTPSGSSSSEQLGRADRHPEPAKQATATPSKKSSASTNKKSASSSENFGPVDHHPGTTKPSKTSKPRNETAGNDNSDSGNSHSGDTEQGVVVHQSEYEVKPLVGPPEKIEYTVTEFPGQVLVSKKTVTRDAPFFQAVDGQVTTVSPDRLEVATSSTQESPGRKVIRHGNSVVHSDGQLGLTEYVSKSGTFVNTGKPSRTFRSSRAAKFPTTDTSSPTILSLARNQSKNLPEMQRAA